MIQETGCGTPLTAGRLSVICYSLIRELFSGEIQEELQAFCQYGQAGKPELLAALHPHYIPFRTVGNQGGFLPAVTLDYLYLETEIPAG